MGTEEEIKEHLSREVLSSFNTQFAENQNHHQRLFIQFISAVFVAVAAFAFVYTGTRNDAEFFDASRGIKEVQSYSVVHLVASYVIAQTILSSLCLVILNIGYAFRRDQVVNYRIRNYALEPNVYGKIFQDKSFKGFDLSRRDYLPTFNAIFFFTIVVMQGVILIAMLISSFNLKNYENNWFGWAMRAIFTIPPLVSICSHSWFFRKYKKNVHAPVNEGPQEKNEGKVESDTSR